MITTVSFTRCWRNVRLSLPALLLCVCIGLGLATTARAQSAQVDVDALRLERTEEGVFLSAMVRFDLPAIVEDALLKGIPMYFVAEAELYRDRWYWYDKKVATTERHLRLAYQPLTRRWRLNVSPRPIGNAGLGVTLTQNFESLPDALASLQRISRWKIGEAADVEPDSRHNVDFRFRLDVSQLPRPFQIGAVGQNSWNISATRNQRMVVESAR